MIKYQFRISSVAYNPEVGEFRWIVCYKKPSKNGQLATHKMPNGYLYIKADGRHHSASRLAWRLVYGDIPDNMEIDHINRVCFDNRICNLRITDRAGNLANSIRPVGNLVIVVFPCIIGQVEMGFYIEQEKETRSPITILLKMQSLAMPSSERRRVMAEKPLFLLAEAWGEIRINEDAIALVDSDYIEQIKALRWSLLRRSASLIHATTKWHGYNIYMHHIIIGRPINGLVVDHINGNGLDNRRQNLRVVSRRVNTLNSDRCRSSNIIEAHGRKYRIRPYINGVRTNLGSFATWEEAEEALRRYKECAHSSY